jgi:transposase InsO family protein
LIGEAVKSGARLSLACGLVGISCRTYQRWTKTEVIQQDRRILNTAPAHNRLSEAIRLDILQTINKEEYQTMTPHQIVPALLDVGIYLASEATFYRIMRENQQLKHRSKSKPKKRKKPMPLQAIAPNQIYSWDITYLSTPIRGQYYYLYFVMDIFSRKLVGWQVHDEESSALAADLIQNICEREKIKKNQLVIHSDNGSPMKGATLRAKMDLLKVDLSYSRPRVSNDNPYSESLFKTTKYHPTFPDKPFISLAQARDWVENFVGWYNEEHRHSGIKFVTPNQRHNHEDREILAKRKIVIEGAKRDFPERWNNRETRNLDFITEVLLNPGRANNSRTKSA